MIEEARERFDRMPEKDDVSWSAIIDGITEEGITRRPWKFSRKCRGRKLGRQNLFCRVC